LLAIIPSVNTSMIMENYRHIKFIRELYLYVCYRHNKSVGELYLTMTSLVIYFQLSETL
jgi:hypothetical protein